MCFSVPSELVLVIGPEKLSLAFQSAPIESGPCGIAHTTLLLFALATALLVARLPTGLAS